MTARFLLLIPALAVAGIALQQATAAPPDAARGRKIVESGTAKGAPACVGCHKPDGSGDANGPFPRLAGQFADYQVKQLKDFASGARASDVMGPIAQAMSEAEMADASAYYAAAHAPYPPVQAGDPALLGYGSTLANVGSQEKAVQACVNCHGPQGTGLAPDYPYLAGQYAAYMKAQYQAWRQGQRTNDPLHVMRTIFSHLDEHDIDALGAYFAVLRPATIAEPVYDGSSAPQPAASPKPQRKPRRPAP